MDALIQKGELCCGCNGQPVRLSAEQAVWQRALVRLAVRRGSLPHAPDFGSRLFAIRTGSPQKREQEALFAVREALAPMPEVQVRGVRCAWDSSAARLTVQVQLQSAENQTELEVRI